MSQQSTHTAAGAAWDDALQRYVDGDLEGDEAAAYSASPQTERQAEELRAFRRDVRAALQRQAEGQAPDFESLFSRIATEIESGPATAASTAPAHDAETAAVVDLDSRRDGAHPMAARPRKALPMRAVLWPSLAVAAALALTWLLPAQREDLPGATPGGVLAGTQILQVDFGDQVGTVFSLQGQAGQPVALVWLSDGNS